MTKDKPCSCKGRDKNCFKCAGTGSYDLLLLKRAASYNQPYSPRLQRIPNQVEDPGYKSQSSVMRAGGTRGLSSLSKLKCSHCNEVFSGLVAIQHHTLLKHVIPAFVEAKVMKQTQSPVKSREKIPCHLCKKLCDGRLGLVSHVRKKHPESLSADGTSYAT